MIKDIFKLNETKKLDYGKESYRSLVYFSVGSELTYSEKSPSVDDFIDEIIFRCTVSGTDKFTEDDLELIVWALMVKNNAEYLLRQRSYEGEDKKLRLDMLMKTAKGEYVMIELKRETATKEALDNQLRSYMAKVMSEFHPAGLRGIIVARNASPDLQKELSKTENADISFAPYKFAFSSKWIEKRCFNRS